MIVVSSPFYGKVYWDRIRSDWYYARGLGSVSLRSEGWCGSASGYPYKDTDVAPVVGPFKTATEACRALQYARAGKTVPKKKKEEQFRRPGCTCRPIDKNGKRVSKRDQCNARWIRCVGAANANYDARVAGAKKLVKSEEKRRKT